MILRIENKFRQFGSVLETLGFARNGPVPYRSTILVTVVIGVLSIMPVVWYSHLPLADYPNHLAAIQIHKTLPSNPYLSNFFEFRWTITPYLGFDLLTFPFMYYLPIELVGRIAIILCFLIIYGGTILLDRQLNHDNWGISLFSGILFYNGALNYGFISYIIGVGFAICAFWMWVRYREKADGPCILAFILSGGLVCVMHLYAFGIYAVCVASYECSLFWERLGTERRLSGSLFRIPLIAVATLIIPLAALSLSPIATSPGPIGWGHGPSFWAALARKVEALASPIFYCDPVFEFPLLLIIFALFIWAVVTQTIVVNRRMVIPLGTFAVIFIVMPFTLLGSSYADYRLPSAVAFITLASFGWGKTSPARINLVCLLLALCLIVRVGSVFSEWQPAQAVISEYDRALRLVPPGSRLLVIVGHTFWGDRKPPLRFVPVLAAAKQGVFDPRTMTDGGGEPKGTLLLKLKPDFHGYWQDNYDSTGPSSASDFKKFDYLMKIRDPSAKIPEEIFLEEIERGRTFVLYRIRQQSLPKPG
jgi:hypothetical protein